MKKIAILVISHKPCKVPNSSIYYPIEVNADAHKQPIFKYRDNTGDNISSKNPNYCELSGLYWAYKNFFNDFDIVGLVHYRRFFVKNNFCFRKNLRNVIDEKTILKILSKKDFILPKKRHYYIETNYSHYIHAHKKEALDLAGEIIKKDYPQYYSSFEKVMNKRSGHYFNMFITRKELAIKYCDWMFDILFKLEKQIDLNDYKGNEARVFGFVSELLMDTFIYANNLSYKNQKYLFMEKQNWFKKGFNFIKRRFSK